MYKKVLEGSLLENNNPPQIRGRETVYFNGTHNGKKTSFGINEQILSKNNLIIGGIGTGKTNFLYHLISQIKSNMNQNDVMIVFDSKGDFYKKFFNKGKDFVVSNSKRYRDESCKWNIFKEILADGWEQDDYIVNTREICNSLFAERIKNSTSNVFFPNAARDLLASIMIMMIRIAREDLEFRNKHLYNIGLSKFLQESTRKDIIDLLKDSDMQSIISYIEGDNAQSQGVLSEMYSVIKEVFIGKFNERGMFSIRDIIKNKSGQTIFIEFDLSAGSVLAPIYRILFDLALKEALSQENTIGNIYIICDEFSMVPFLNHIDNGVNFGREKGVKISIALQNISQLYEIYGEHRSKNIISGFSSIYAFKTNDYPTRSYLTDYFGTNIVLEQYKDFSNKLQEQKRIGNVVEDWNIMSLDVGEAIVSLPFSKPFKFKFDEYK